MYNEQAEKFCLAGILSNPDRSHILFKELKEEDFSEGYKSIYKLYKKLYDLNKLTFDNISIGAVENQLTLIISELIEHQHTSYNIKDHIKEIKSSSYKRKVLDTCKTIECEIHGGESLDLNTFIEDKILSLLKIENVTNYKHIKDVCVESLQYMDKVANGWHGIRTNFKDIDDIIMWYEPGDLVVIAARPSMGKTAFALRTIQNIAEQNYNCGIISLEMTRKLLIDRLISGICNIDMRKIRAGLLSDNEAKSVIEASNILSKLNIIIDDDSGYDIHNLISKIRFMKRRNNIDIVMIDYLGLIKGDKKHQNKNLEVGDITLSLKSIAKELGIVVILLSQLNRGVEDRADKRPMMSDLRESGAIEQDADIIQMLYRDDYYKEASEYKNQLEVIFRKNRNGPTNTARLYCNFSSMKIENLENIYVGGI